ncbi:MAG: SpoIIE family protein phosphatase [Chloroflexi bacterium]|nr:SpoIIE family protein phosphatase [Chloroflexota bacterium]
MLESTVASFQDNSAHGEDNFLLRDLGNGNFLDAVMDGVTGHGGGEASQSVVDALAAASLASPEDVISVLKEVNDEFFQVGGGRFLLTTISAVLFLDGQVHVIGAGDSPVFLVDTESSRQLSGRIGGFLHVGVAQAIGASENVDNLMRTDFVVEPGTRLVLATDGVTDNILAAELADIVRAAGSPDEAAEQVNSTIGERLEEGRVPEQLGRRFRHDDRTAIFRFFK